MKSGLRRSCWIHVHRGFSRKQVLADGRDRVKPMLHLFDPLGSTLHATNLQPYAVTFVGEADRPEVHTLCRLCVRCACSTCMPTHSVGSRHGTDNLETMCCWLVQPRGAAALSSMNGCRQSRLTTSSAAASTTRSRCDYRKIGSIKQAAADL